MAVLPTTTSSACLELTISVPGSFTSSPSLFPSSGKATDRKRGVTRDLDINQVPLELGEEEWTSGTMELEEDDKGGAPRKKLRLTKEQSLFLEESFRQNHILNPKQKEALAMELKLKPRQVEVWFQNRRARSKLKQTEIECEYLKRWFGSLTQQNKRLQKEVEHLRDMKPLVVIARSSKPLPASNLTMCPRCERVSTTGHRITTTTTTTTAAATNPATLSDIKRPFFPPNVIIGRLDN